jgi:hypothetical protein
MKGCESHTRGPVALSRNSGQFLYSAFDIVVGWEIGDFGGVE